ncbi:MAG: RNA polymerase sigma-70 factor [Ignavibacteriae bacterium]|nr:MAG: RNA polymerase sigma-70 factor [Ignavibacteriota bacterium]
MVEMQSTDYISDEVLFQRMKSDDAKALKALFERYFIVLCRFAFKFVRHPGLAEEAVSDVFLNVWLKKDAIVIKNNLKTYLYTAVKNQSLNYVKKNKIQWDELSTADREHRISDLHADTLITHEEFNKDVNALLQKLPEKRQLIFRMNRFDGLSYKEIAEILSISVHTVQNQMVAAVKFLADHRPHRH